jgi:hypothetical protein
LSLASLHAVDDKTDYRAGSCCQCHVFDLSL